MLWPHEEYHMKSIYVFTPVLLWVLFVEHILTPPYYTICMPIGVLTLSFHITSISAITAAAGFVCPRLSTISIETW